MFGGGAGILGEGVGDFEGVLAEFPGAEAVLGPVVEVLFGDGLGVEVFGEDGLDFGEGVEPVEDGLVRLSVVEAAIDLVAERTWQASDFTQHIMIIPFFRRGSSLVPWLLAGGKSARKAKGAREKIFRLEYFTLDFDARF